MMTHMNCLHVRRLLIEEYEPCGSLMSQGKSSLALQSGSWVIIFCGKIQPPSFIFKTAGMKLTAIQSQYHEKKHAQRQPKIPMHKNIENINLCETESSGVLATGGGRPAIERMQRVDDRPDGWGQTIFQRGDGTLKRNYHSSNLHFS